MPSRGGNLTNLPVPRAAPRPAPSLLGNVGSAISHAGASAGRAIHTQATHSTYTTPRSGGSDAATSGPGYGAPEANAYKRTPAYHQAVKAVFNAQPLSQKAAIIRGISQVPKIHWTPEIRAIREAFRQLPVDQATALQHYLPHIRWSPGKIISGGLGAVDSFINDLANIHTGPRTPGQIVAEQSIGAGAPIELLKAPIDIARATAEDPGVLPKTVKGLGETAAGSAAALVELPIKMVEQKSIGGPLGQLASSVARDYSQRYGPLLHGNDRAFIDRIKKQGAGAEVLDTLGAVGGIDATLGRAVTDMAHVREAFRGEPNFLTRARPKLRTSGGEARPQALGKGAGKITAQRIEDRLRAARTSKIPLRNNEVAPVFQGRSARVLVSTVASKRRHMMQADLNKSVRGGAVTATQKLSKWERKAMPVAIEGWIPLRKGAQAARQAIDQRIEMIRQDRLNGGALNPGNRIPAQLASVVDELPLLQDLHAHAEQWATPRLAAFVDREAARSAELERSLPSSYTRPETAEARRLAPQGEMLGIEHPDTAHARYQAALHEGARPDANVGRLGALSRDVRRERQLTAATGTVRQSDRRLANYENNRPALLREYVQKIRDQRPADWHEPAYIKHTANPRTANHADFSAYTQGGGGRAMGAPRQSKFINFRAGVVDRRPQAYFDSLARSIKASHQWRLVDEMFHRNALPTPTRTAIRSALGHDVHPGNLTGRELQQVLLHMGVDLRHVKFYNPGRLAETTLADHGLLRGNTTAGVPHELEASADLHDALGQHEIAAEGHSNDERFLTTAGWKAIPKDAFDEIHSSLHPSGAAGRLWGKVQGLTAGAILGLSPSFVVMNTLAHIYLAAFGTRGRLLTDAAKFPLWWHSLTDEERTLVRAHAGGRGQYRLERMGSTAQSDIVNGWRELQQSGIGRFIGALNPARALFKAENMQSDFFRHMVYYSHAKRMAIDNIAKNMGPGAEAMARVSQAFSAGPRDEMARLLHSQAAAEELGRRTVDMMGDYTRFTAAERKWLNNRAVLFYSFLRHASRILFYVLPFKHPIITALTSELTQLHNDEVKKLLGGQDVPWAYSRVFFNKSGKLTSVDFLRASPVGGAAVDVANEGMVGLSKLIAPEVQPLIDLMYGQTPGGKKTGSPFFTALNDYLSLSYPYRLARDLQFGVKTQQADSIPFVHERPASHKTKAAQQYQAAKEKASGPLEQRLLAGFLGAYPKPDDTAVIAQRRAELAAHKGKGHARSTGSGWGNPVSTPAPSGGWGAGASSTAKKAPGWG